MDSLVVRFKIAAKALIREHKVYEEDIETLIEVLHILEHVTQEYVMATPETIAWVPVNSTLPAKNRRVYVHALNQWFITAKYDPDTQQFWDKDGQPVVAPIEWSYRDDRPE